MEPETNNNEQGSSQTDPMSNTETPNGDQMPSGDVNHENLNEDFSRYRSFAILGYILPFLFFLPLLDEKTKNVPYVRFHANQQLILLIVAFGVYVIHNVLYITIMFSYLMLAQLLNLGLLIFAVIGIYNAYNNKMKELPFIGQFQILK
jgi:uncharacterized membrane protein